MTQNFTMRNPVIDKIIDVVCEDFYVEKKEIIGKSRRREFVVVRHAIMAICKEFTQVSLKNIGRHFGSRDHSSVMHGINSTSDLIDTDKVFRQKMLDVKTMVVVALGGSMDEGEEDEFYSELLHCENWESKIESKPLEPIEE